MDLAAFAPLVERIPELDLGVVPVGAAGGPPSNDPFFERYTWAIVSQNAGDLALFGQPPSDMAGGPPATDDTHDASGDNSIDAAMSPPYAYASLINTESGWVLSGWGQCRVLVSAPGWGPASFVLAAEPDAASTTLSLLATETACASGNPPTDRQVTSVVIENATSASIVILIEPDQGNQTCPGNPAFPVEVELGAPLAGRTIVDAGIYPALTRPWPPSDTSVESGGLTE